MERLKGKVIAIAGGTGGIGTEVSKRYAAEGASVLVGSRDIAHVQDVVDAIIAAGGKATAETVDIGDNESVERFVARGVEIYGGLDGFHANAAYFSPQDLDAVDMPLEVFNDVMHINAGGFFSCTRHAVPEMLKRGGGVILYTSSGSAHTGDAARVAYSMAKSSVHALMRHVAVRWGREGIRANVIAPGVIWHDSFERQAPQMKEWALQKSLVGYLGEPADIAAMSALLMSDEGKFVTGQVISVDGGGSMRL